MLLLTGCIAVGKIDRRAVAAWVEVQRREAIPRFIDPHKPE